jgi:hypothetical protein
LARNPVLRGYVAARLREDWSPEQIAGTLKKRHPDGSRMRVSHETIYKSLFAQTRGVLARDLLKHLRSGRPTRRNIHNTVTLQWRSQIKDAVSIWQRPAEVEDRAVPGHWEGDLIIGRHWTQMATVVERSCRVTVLAQLDSRDMITVSAGLTRDMSKLAQHLRKSLTWDRGMWNLPTTRQLPPTPGWTSTSPTREAPGSEERTRTQMVYYANIFPRATAWPTSLKTILTLSRRSSTTDHAKALWAFSFDLYGMALVKTRSRSSAQLINAWLMNSPPLSVSKPTRGNGSGPSIAHRWAPFF